MAQRISLDQLLSEMPAATFSEDRVLRVQFHTRLE